MKQVYLIGFKGVNFLDKRYKNEHPLIWAGHVGIAFEGQEAQIWGFHPSPQAIEKVGGIDIAFALLRKRKLLDGTFQEESPIFLRAYRLSQTNPIITVWQSSLTLSDEKFEAVKLQVMA